MIFWHHILSFTVICLWHIHAAPQRRSCHDAASVYVSGSNSSLPTDTVTDAGLLTTPSLLEPSTSTLISTDNYSSDSNSNGDTDGDGDGDISAPITSGTLTTFTQLFTLGSVTPKIILVYTNTTMTIVPTAALTSTPTPTPFANITTQALFPNTTMPYFTTPSTTRFILPTTTPDMDAMQTAYYYSVCAWEQHLNDAICLGGNTMLCCRADNERCNAYLMDGGLSCEGIESGNWATTWARKTVTLGVDDAVTSGSASSITDTTLYSSLPSTITITSDTGSMTLDAITNSDSDSITTHLRITASASADSSTTTDADTTATLDTTTSMTTITDTATSTTMDVYPTMSTSTVTNGRVKVIPIGQR